MVTGTTEQLAQAGEQGKQPSETKQQQPASDAKAQTSTTGAQAAESVTTTPNVTFDFNSPEFAEAVKKVAFPLAQSMKDKELKPLKEKLSRFEEKEADAEAERQLKAEEEQWETEGATPASIKTFQDARKDFIKASKAHNTAVGEFQEKRLVYEAKDALISALYGDLPQDKIDFLIKESTDEQGNLSVKALRLMAKEVAAEIKKAAAAPAETEKPAEKKGPSRPDPSAHSVTGGIDVNGMSPRDKIAYGLQKERKRQ